MMPKHIHSKSEASKLIEPSASDADLPLTVTTNRVESVDASWQA